MDWPHALELYYEELEKHVENIVEQLQQGELTDARLDQLVYSTESSYMENPHLCFVVLYSMLLPYQQRAADTLEFFNDCVSDEAVPDLEELQDRYSSAAATFMRTLRLAVTGELAIRLQLREKREAAAKQKSSNKDEDSRC